MLQFNQSQVSNSNVVYLNTVDTGSAYYDNIVVVLSQSYDNSNLYFEATTVSAPTQYNQWLMITNSGSQVPDYTGQYDVSLYTGDFVDAIWNQVAINFDAYDGIHTMKFGMMLVTSNPMFYYIQTELGCQVAMRVT